MSDQKSDLSFKPASKASSDDAIPVCKCLLSSSEESTEVIPQRKAKIFSMVSKTESYLRDRRIPELMRFMLTKIIAANTRDPVKTGIELLDDCMLFRAGIGTAPVLFENRHLEAIIRSFDPGNRGWLSAGQVRRAFITIGLNPDEDLNEERYPTEEVLNKLRTVQERDLYNLLRAGTVNEPAEAEESETESTSKV